MRFPSAAGVAVLVVLAGCGDSPVDPVRAGVEPQLTALGYLERVEDDDDPDRRGVVAHDPARACPGITVLGCRGDAREAALYDMDGAELHAFRPGVDAGRSLLWMEPTSDGDLLVVGRGYLARTGFDGSLRWQAPPAEYHHGLAQGAAEQVYAMTTARRIVDAAGRRREVLDDSIVELSADGHPRKRISLLDLVGADRIPWRVLDSIPAENHRHHLDRLGIDHPGDVLHLNSVEVIARDTAFARRGDLLVCLRSLDLVLAVDPERERIVWEWTAGRKILDRPHRPTALDNGNLLVFDNGWRRGASRVLEIDPVSSQIVWQYPETPSPEFFTKRGGLAQPLANGNLLITESDRGHVFEITRSGDIVWDFWNPKFKRGRRQTVYRAWRWTDRELGLLHLPGHLATALADRGHLGAGGSTREPAPAQPTVRRPVRTGVSSMWTPTAETEAVPSRRRGS